MDEVALAIDIVDRGIVYLPIDEALSARCRSAALNKPRHLLFVHG